MKKLAMKFLSLATVLVLIVGVTPLVASARTISPPQPHQTRPIPTRGGNRNTTWIEFDLNENYIVKGLTAQDTLGRPAATISDFAAAMANYMGEDTIIFAGNFFVTATNEIVGAVYSQGRLVSGDPQPWLDQGVGFTADNRLSFFRGRINNGHVYGFNWYESRLPYVTAFNMYPHLISGGTRLPIVAGPAMTQQWLDGRVQRAFMGQRADGSFVLANVTGANISETQDIAVYFGLYNATNIDGGASAGIWRNGSYITTPGRLLPHVVFITSTAPVAQEQIFEPVQPPISQAAPSHYNIVIGNVPVSFYVDGVHVPPANIDGRLLIPVRTVANALGAEVNWNDETQSVTLTRDGRVVVVQIGNPLVVITYQGRIDTLTMDVPGQLIGGRTFLPLRALFVAFGYLDENIIWDNVTRTATIER